MKIKISSLFSENNKEHQIEVKEVEIPEDDKKTYSLSWKFNPRELVRSQNNDEYIMFLK